MGDGMEDAHRAHKQQEQLQKRMTRQKAERCMEELSLAREQLREAEETINPLKRKIALLETELEGMLK